MNQKYAPEVNLPVPQQMVECLCYVLEDPGISFEDLGKQLGITPEVVVEFLSYGQWRNLIEVDFKTRRIHPKVGTEITAESYRRRYGIK